MGLKRRHVLATIGSSTLFGAAGCLSGGGQAEGTDTASTDQQACTGTIAYAHEEVDYRCEYGEVWELEVRGEASNCSEVSLTTPDVDHVVALDVSSGAWSYSNSSSNETTGGLRGSQYQLLDPDGNVIAEEPVRFISPPKTLFVFFRRFDPVFSAGEVATIPFIIEYNGVDDEVSYTTELSIDGTTVASKERTIEGPGGMGCTGTRQEDEFTHRFQQTGEFEVSLTAEADGTYETDDAASDATVTVEEENRSDGTNSG